MSTRAFLEHAVEEAETALAHAVVDIDEARAALAAHDPYPVGTILREVSEGGQVHQYAAKVTENQNCGFHDCGEGKGPRQWITYWTDDGSGSAYHTLAELKESRGGEWVVAFNPTSIGPDAPPTATIGYL